MFIYYVLSVIKPSWDFGSRDLSRQFIMTYKIKICMYISAIWDKGSRIK